ncbi:PREDICTED: corticoliberin, partial [Buceros rhinoceros silvestris]|uniref:corticoliberin n=1 Tax=Buceros rhinoceros silvestris TaxID=175836 RepID=UPI000528A015
QQQQEQQQTLPVLLRMGEEYFLRLGNLNKRPVGSFSASPISTSHLQPEASASNFFRAAVPQLQQLPERSLGSPEEGEAQGEAVEREKRSEEPPISLDLTFHLLREVLEMARAEQLAQQAHTHPPHTPKAQLPSHCGSSRPSGDAQDSRKKPLRQPEAVAVVV